MIGEIINWIDKELVQVNDRPIFKKYFEEQVMTEGENVFYLANKESGIEVVMPVDFVIDTIHLFSGNKQDGFKSFKGDLPFGLSFSNDMEVVRSVIGRPDKSGGGHRALYIGLVSFWDKFYFENYSLHFSYTEDCKSIEKITIASMRLEEYFNSSLQ